MYCHRTYTTSYSNPATVLEYLTFTINSTSIGSMNSRVVVAALLTALLALLPVVYLYFIWPTVLAFVPMHYGASGVPDHFVERIWLWNIVWYPALGFVVFTFLPQVHEGQSLFWSSSKQRQTRLVVVFALALPLTALIHRSSQNSRPGLLAPASSR